MTAQHLELWNLLFACMTQTVIAAFLPHLTSVVSLQQVASPT